MLCILKYFVQLYCFLFILVARGKTCITSTICILKHKTIINSYLVVVFIVYAFVREIGTKGMGAGRVN